MSLRALDDMSARSAGQLCGATHPADVIDASVVLCARRRGHGVLTSDADELRRLLFAALRIDMNPRNVVAGRCS
jgi:hypothetical protein